MVSKWLSLLAFAGGLAVGREVKAKKVKVPPSVIFLPPSHYLEKEEEKIDVRAIIEEKAKERGLKLGEKELEKYVEYYTRLAELLRLREKYLSILEAISKRFCEGKIGRKVYLMLMSRYEEKLAEVEIELRRLGKV